MRAFFFGIVAALVGCATPEADAPAPTWYEDVQPIVQTSCASCHDGSGLSGIQIDSYEQAFAWKVAIGAAVEDGTMPPWGADDACTDYQNDFSLSPEDKQTILDWVAADGPEGDPQNAAPDAAPWVPPSLDRVDLSLEMDEPHTPTAGDDDYRCFVMEWPYEDDAWVTGFDIAPGNDSVVHHVVPFLISPDDADEFRQMDAEEEGYGYTCYGGPGGDVLTLVQTRWLGGWTPGAGAMEMPEGHGLHVPPGSLLVLQLHYSGGDGEQSDQSKLNLRVETEPMDEARIYRWTDVAWVVGVGMEIPANTTGVEHTFTYNHTPTDARYQVHSIMGHMHAIGRSIDVKIHHPDGSSDCLLSVPRYDFNWQRTYWLEEPVDVGPGDELEVTCVWDNPTDQEVAWGDSTGDEMCLAVAVVTEESGDTVSAGGPAAPRQ